MGINLWNQIGSENNTQPNSSTNQKSSKPAASPLWNVVGTGLPSGETSTVDISSYEPYLNKKGVHLSEDIDTERAQNQSAIQQIGRGVGNAVANTVTGILQAPGYLAEIFDPKNDYTNDWIEFFNKVHNPLGEIYKEHPDKQIDLKDFGWYADWLQSLAEGAAALGTFTAGIGGVSAKLAEGIGALMDLEKGGAALKAIKGTAQLGTAMTSAYVEGAMSGNPIYKEVYQKQYDNALRNGYDPATADKIATDKAGKGAAATVRTNTIVNTLLNLGEVAAIFHEPEAAVKKFIKGEGAMLEGEGTKDYLKRIRSMTLEDPAIMEHFNPRKGINSYAAEMLKEGIEEVNTQESEYQGRRIGAGEEHDSNIMDMLGNYIKHYAGDVTNQEGLLNFVSGAAMGPAQAFLIDHISPRYTYYNAEGKREMDMKDGKVVIDPNTGEAKYKTFLVNSKTYNERAVKATFDNYRDALADHLEKVDALNVKLADAVSKGNALEAEKVRHELFTINAFQGIELGIADQWKKQYEQIAEIDNTKDLGEQLQPQIDSLTTTINDAKQNGEDTTEMEQKLQSLLSQQQKVAGKTAAMNAGYAIDANDHSYKERALEYAAHMDHLERMYHDIHRQYTDEADPITEQVANHLFVKKANLYLAEKAIAKEESRIAGLESLDDLDTVMSSAVVDPEVSAWNKAVDEHNAKQSALTEDGKKLQEAVRLLQASSPVLTEEGKQQFRKRGLVALNELVGKYGVNVNIDEQTDPHADADKVASEIKAIHERNKADIDARREAMKNSIGYNTWAEKNEGKSIQDYLNEVAASNVTRAERAQLEVYKQEHANAVKNYQQLTRDNTKADLYRQFREHEGKLQEELKKMVQQQDAESFYRQRQRAAVAQLTADQKAKEYANKQSELEEKSKQLSSLQQRVAEIKEQIKTFKGIWANKTKLLSLYRELAAAKKMVENLTNEIGLIKSQLEILGKQTQATQQKAAEVQQAPPPPTKKEMKENPTTSQMEVDQHDSEEDMYDQMVGAPPVPESWESTDYEESGAGQDYETDENGLIKLPDTAVKEFIPETNNYLDEMSKLNPKQAEVAKQVELKMDALTAEDLKNNPTVGLQELTDAGLQRLQPLMRDAVMEKKSHTAEELPAPVGTTELVSQPAATVAEPISSQQQDLEQVDETIDDGDTEIQQPVVSSPYDVQEMLTGDKAQSFSKVNFNNVINERQELVQQPGTFRTVNKTVGVQVKGVTINTYEINPSTNKDTLRIGHFVPGAKLQLAVDEDFNDLVNSYQKLDSDTGNYVQERKKFSDWLDEKGKIDRGQTMSVPIKIIDATTGKSIGYLPTEDFLTAKDGEGNYINHTLTEDQLAVELADNSAIRDHLIMRWEKGITTPLETTVNNVSNGHLTYAGKAEKGEITYQTYKADKMLFDKNMVFGSVEPVRSGAEVVSVNFLTHKNTPTTLPLVEMTDSQKKAIAGGIVAYIPLTNGLHMPVPMTTPKLSAAEVKGLATAIEWHLQLKQNIDNAAAKEGRAKILEATGHDISKIAGLKEFVKQYYTPTTNFNDEEMVKASGIPRKMLHIGSAVKDGKFGANEIKVGVTMNAGSLVKAKLVNGKLDSAFAQALENIVKDKFKTINLSDGKRPGLNMPGEFNAVEIMGEGRVRTQKFDSYNDYAKSILETSLYGGTNIDKEGNISYTPRKGKDVQYVYNVNSQIHFDPAPLMQDINSATELVAQAASSPAEAGLTEITPVQSEDKQEIADRVKEFFSDEVTDDDFDNFNKPGDVEVKSFKIDQGGMELTLDNLEKLSNLASVNGNRNALTTQEVFDRYQKLGITSINPDIHNPFEKC